MKLTYKFLLTILIVGTSIIVVLTIHATRPSAHISTFSRSLTKGLTKEATLDLTFNSYYFAGNLRKRIVLANAKIPGHLVTIDPYLTDLQSITFTLADTNLHIRPRHVFVDFSHFYILNGGVPAIFHGSTSDWKAHRYAHDSAFFSIGMPISNNSVVMRAVSSTNKESIIVKESMNPPELKTSITLLQKQIDGIFCTDGMLLYNKERHCIIYVYYYRNQFIVADTSLNLQARFRTIDPVDSAQITVARISSQDAITMSSPPLRVNRRSCTWGDWLFVNSDLQAQNEHPDEFRTNAVVDVYSIKTGKYHGSFYIPDYQEIKAGDFQVGNDYLVCLYGKFLIKYHLDLNAFQKYVFAN